MICCCLHLLIFSLLQVDFFAAETEANKELSPQEIKAALEAKSLAIQEVAIQSLKCFPFFLPRLSNLREGMMGQVDFIWIGYHGALLSKESGFLAKYSKLLSEKGMFVLHSCFVFTVLPFVQMEPFVNITFSRYHLHLQSLN